MTIMTSRTKVITILVILSLLYSSCVYAFPVWDAKQETLAIVSPLTQPGPTQVFRNLDRLLDTLEEPDVFRKIEGLREMLSQILDDEPSGLSVFYNRKLKEVFVFGKGGVIQIYVGKHTLLPSKPIEEYCAGRINAIWYPFSPEVLNILKKIGDLILIEGVPEPRFAPEEKSRIVIDRIIMILKREGNYSEGRDIIDLINSLPDSGLKDYLKALISLIETPARQVIPAYYAIVPENLQNSSGSNPAGWLWKDWVPGLEPYSVADLDSNVNQEAKNALRIRDHILSNGRQLAGKGFIDFPINIMVWDGPSGEDKDLNVIITRNIRQLLLNLAEQESYELLHNLKRSISDNKIAVGILDRSRHWCENCRGDGFIGVNRYLLEKILKTLLELAAEKRGENRGEEIKKIKDKLAALEKYLQTYLYHELRHEAFMEERKLLSEMMYEDSGLGKVFDVDDLDIVDLINIIDSLKAGVKERFNSELERRQNGLDAGYFVKVSGGKYEEYLNYLIGFNILNMDSLFLHASAIVGFASEEAGNKHCNELLIDDFGILDKDRLARVVYTRYEKDYEGMYRKDMENVELEYRGKISYLLYQTGLNNYIRVDFWRKKTDLQRQHDRDLAKRYVIRLIDFVSRYERYIAHIPRRGEVSMFRLRERSLSPRESAQMLTVSILSNGDYSQAILRTGLAFKTSGIVNTVTTNRSGFWKLVEEACAERASKGDSRFKDITFETMKRASIERELLPRLRIIYPFKGYLLNLPGARFQQAYKDMLRSFCWKYERYRRGEAVSFDDEEIEEFYKLYRKIHKVLSGIFGIAGDESDVEGGDLLVTLWNTFDFIDNLFPDLGYHFTEPLLQKGVSGGGDSDKTLFKRDEIDEIVELKKVFYKDMEDILPKDITAEDTKRRVQLILRIYKDKILRYSEGLYNILNRYGSSKDIDGNRVWELMRLTRGWAGAVWIAREYSGMFRAGLIERTLELNSGLSIFYRALLSIGFSDPKTLSGVRELIGDKTSEYFGSNPNRFAGDVTGDDWIDMRTGEHVKEEKELYQLICSIYNLHTITSPRRMYSIFKEVNRLLKYGGHFVITLPPGRMFSEQSLEAIKEKMGFEPVVTPGVTWNELSEETRERMRGLYSSERVEREIRELKKKKFYVIILKKLGKVKEGKEELQGKSLLIPSVISDKEVGRTLEPVEVPLEEDTEPVEPEAPIYVGTEEKGWGSPGIIDGIHLEPGTIARDLERGLEESRRLKEKAENVGVISEYKKLIEELLESEITPPEKLKDYIKQDLRDRIAKALSYNDSDYTLDIETELFNLLDILQKLKEFIQANHGEFVKKIDEIRKWGRFAPKLSGADRDEFNRITGFKKTDLSEETLRVLQDIHGKLSAIEKSEIYIDENWAEFEALQRMIRKYSIFVTDSWDRKNMQDVISARREDLSPKLMAQAKRLDEAIAGRFSLDKIKFSSIKDLESMISKLAKWKDCGFLFTLNDIEFLNRFIDEWKKDVLPESCLDFLSDIKRLHACMEVVGDWEILKDNIDWERGLAALLADTSEDSYMYTLYKKLLFSPFVMEKGLYARVTYISSTDTGESIADNLSTESGNLSMGEGLVIEIPDNFGITGDFISALGSLGLEVGNIYKIWLEIDKNVGITPDSVRAEVERCMRCEKTLIVVKKIGTASNIDHALFRLTSIQQKDQDYNSWLPSREIILQNLLPGDFRVCSSEILSRGQIGRLYPEWAGEFLGKGDWQGDFFDKTRVTDAVAAYEEEKEAERRRREEEKKRRLEREARLIKMASEPAVKITYGGIWTESAVRDLAQVLLEVISDFSNPPAPDLILEHQLIALHPQLNKISREDLLAKIEELIRYKQYDLHIERFYRELARLLGFIMPEGPNRMDFLEEIDGIKKFVPLANVCQIGGLLLWHEYQLGIDPSPFGRCIEELYNDILGNLLMLKRFDPGKSRAPFPIKDSRLVMHFLSDPDGILKQFSGKVSGLDIAAGGESAGVESSVLQRIINEQSRGNRKVPGVMRQVQGIYARAGRVFMLLSGIYKNKSLDIKYLKELLDLIDRWYSYIDTLMAKGGFEIGELIELSALVIDNLGSLFNGQMTFDEYAAFVDRLKQRLATAERPQAERPGEAGLSSFYYYMHGDGQEKTIRINSEDTIISKFMDRESGIKYYLDILKLIRPVRLYKLPGEEKMVLDQLIDDLISAPDEDVENAAIAQVIAYIRISNSINRYLYFANKYLSKTWGQDSIAHADALLDTVTEEIIRVEPRVAVFTHKAEAQNIVVLLTELYRLKQMTEDAALTEDVKLELQLYLIRLVGIIRKKVSDLKQMLGKDEASVEKLFHELSAIGNKCHIDLIHNIVIGIPHLKQADELNLYANLEVPKDEAKRENLRYIVEELRLSFLYFPEEKEVALQNVANVLASYGMTDERVRYFMDLFGQYIPGEIGGLRSLIKGARPKSMPSIEGQTIDVRDALNSNKVPKEVAKRIERDQGFRCLVISVIQNFSEFSPATLHANRGTFIQLLTSAIIHMENPYEIYHTVKTLTTSPVAGGVVVQPDILPLLATRLVGFLEMGGNDRSIIDILTRTYNQYFTMKDFIKHGMHEKPGLRRYMAGLFVKGDYVASSYAYHYIRDYIEMSASTGDKERGIHEILLYIINALLEDGDGLNVTKFKRALMLFAAAVLEEPGITLQQEWDAVIQKYKQGVISKKTLLDIMRNAGWMIDDTCNEYKGDKGDLRLRFGLLDQSGENIFEKAVREHEALGYKDGEDAYFGRMTQKEINPQIKKILSPVKGETEPERMRRLKNFIFIQGETIEGEKGELELSLEQRALLDAFLAGYPELKGYGIAVLKGVNFNGHYSAKRGGRIYIPLEILEIVQGCKKQNLKWEIHGEKRDLGDLILEDFIEHEYLHSKGFKENKIIALSEHRRPGVYEKAREVYRGYIAERLVNVVGDVEGLDILKDKLNAILRRVQEGKPIELNEVQLHRLLWLIERSKDINIVPQIAQLVDLILKPDYTGDPGRVIMAIEKEIFSFLYTAEQVSAQEVERGLKRITDTEGENLLVIRRTVAGLRVDGPKKVKNTILYVDGFQVPESIATPADIKDRYYVLIDKDKAEKYARILKDVSGRYGVEFVPELPDGVNPEDVIVLVDPEDADREKWSGRGFNLYLPLIYGEKSFIFAAELGIKRPKTDAELKQTKAYMFAKGFYENLLGTSISDEELLGWFKNPWDLKGRLTDFTKELRLLRYAFEQLGGSA